MLRAGKASANPVVHEAKITPSNQIYGFLRSFHPFKPVGEPVLLLLIFACPAEKLSIAYRAHTEEEGKEKKRKEKNQKLRPIKK
jgi:hypothetical protein